MPFSSGANAGFALHVGWDSDINELMGELMGSALQVEVVIEVRNSRIVYIMHQIGRQGGT